MLEIGSGHIRCRGGGSEPPAEMVAAALGGIDDPVVLLGERPVRVDDLLRSLIAQTLGERREHVLVRHPSTWPVPRVTRVLNAVRASADRVTAVSDDEPIAETEPVPNRRRIRLRHSLTGAIVGCAFAAAAAMAVHAWPADEPTMAPMVASAVTEGRIAVLVPDGWTVERLTHGPGSRRVRVTSPADPDQALHITQSYAPGGTLADSAAVLSRAATGQPAFTGFRDHDEIAGRPVITYRENRPGRVIRWAVLLDGVTRISIGCQSRPGAEDTIRIVCDQAIRSAHELAGTGIQP